MIRYDGNDSVEVHTFFPAILSLGKLRATPPKPRL